MRSMASAVLISTMLGFALALLAGSGGASTLVTHGHATPAPLLAANVSLIFAVSPDLQYQASGDPALNTAHLTAQGLRRTLLLAPYLQHKVPGGDNVTAIYALEPMTHLQRASHYPDMAALETVQQFAMINRFTMSSPIANVTPTIGNKGPINVSYAPGAALSGVVTTSPLYPCRACQGLDFSDPAGNNQSLLSGIVSANLLGFYVMSAPSETTHSLLAGFNAARKYHLAVPASYRNPNNIHAISIAPSGTATLSTYNSTLKPPTTYPVLDPGLVTRSACQYSYFTATATQPPSTMKKSETLYFIRHANAHPPVFSRMATMWRRVGGALSILAWNHNDHDSIWTVTIDPDDSLTANNSLCEGIDSNNLPATAQWF